MYRYETHLHTLPVSACATKTAREMIEFYKSLSYDGIFITNHFIDGNIGIDKDKPYDEKIKFYFSGYEEARKEGDKLGMKVFCGVELTYKGTDFLVYGLDEKWFLKHPEIENMKKSKELKLFIENGAFIVQAHPFRMWNYIDHIRLYYNCVHGVEVINGANSDFENQMAELYANHYGLIKVAGSDNHHAEKVSCLAGVECEEPINCVEDYERLAKDGKLKIFVNKDFKK